MSKQLYRNHMEILGEMLGVTVQGGRDGVIISTIARKSNLSHNEVLKKSEKLLNAGLLESQRNNRNRKFTITEKGLLFFEEFQRYQNLMEPLNKISVKNHDHV